MSTVATWPSNAENWLDERGKGAWIAAMVLGFIFFWPVGLALLAYMIWSKRMFSNGCGRHGRHMRRRHFHSHAHRHGFHSSGNSAFDAYKADTLERLEREQKDFESFLERLRAAKDQSEFDDFMDDRAKAARDDKQGKDDDPTVET
ncbi:MAG TPA: DUF2852 domain-containing protein [Aliiroseovarius sp.]|nr:DUF2852 domain-containing protein [Aliiroseovarius sp.]